MLGYDGKTDHGNTAWMLAASAFVMIMTPAVGFFYAGLAGEKSAANTILMSFITVAIVTVQWFLFGYSFAFGPGNGWFGSFQWGALNNVGFTPSGAYGYNIPHVVYCVFQCMFAQITPALITGAVIGRMKFKTYCVFVFVWTTLIYDALAHWMWSWTLDPDTFGLRRAGCGAGARQAPRHVPAQAARQAHGRARRLAAVVWLVWLQPRLGGRR